MADPISAEYVNAVSNDKARRGVGRTLVVIVIFIAMVLGLFVHKILTPRYLTETELRVNGTFVFEQPRKISEFSLQNHTGEPFTLAALKGHWTLMFFGFTACPDVCPATLSVLKDVKSQLPSDVSNNIRFVLVSVDPARDSVEQMSQYVTYFDPEFVGVTGEFLDIKRLANQLNVAFMKVSTGNASDEYTIDHTAHLALINPNGDFHGFVKSPPDQARLTLSLSSILTHNTY